MLCMRKFNIIYTVVFFKSYGLNLVMKKKLFNIKFGDSLKDNWFVFF